MYVIVKLNIIYMSYLYNIYSASIYVTYIYFGERMVINNTYDEECDSNRLSKLYQNSFTLLN